MKNGIVEIIEVVSVVREGTAFVEVDIQSDLEIVAERRDEAETDGDVVEIGHVHCEDILVLATKRTVAFEEYPTDAKLEALVRGAHPRRLCKAGGQGGRQQQ